MAALGSVPRRRGQLCSLLGPRPGPESGSCSWGSGTTASRGAPWGCACTPGCTVTVVLRPAEVGARQAQQELCTPGCAHAPSPRPTQPVTLLPGTARGARQAWGSATQSTRSQWARSAASRQAPGRTDRPKDGRTDTLASRPASHKRTTATTKEQPSGHRGESAPALARRKLLLP